MPALPHPTVLVSDTSAPMSLVRTWQLITTLEDGFHAGWGAGVLSGGKFTATTGFSAEIESGTQFFAEGKRHTLSEAQSYTAAGAGATAYVWGALVRTAGGNSTPETEDSYALTVTHTGTDTTPTHADGRKYFPLSIWTTDSAGITSIDDQPPGKYVRALPNLGFREITLTGNPTLSATQYRDHFLRFLGAGSVVTLPAEAGRAWTIFNQSSSRLEFKTSGQPVGVTVAQSSILRLTVDADGYVVAAEESVGDLSETVETLRAEVDDFRRLFRRLLLHYTTAGLPLPSGLEDEFCLAAGEQG